MDKMESGTCGTRAPNNNIAGSHVAEDFWASLTLFVFCLFFIANI